MPIPKNIFHLFYIEENSYTNAPGNSKHNFGTLSTRISRSWQLGTVIIEFAACQPSKPAENYNRQYRHHINLIDQLLRTADEIDTALINWTYLLVTCSGRILRHVNPLSH